MSNEEFFINNFLFAGGLPEPSYVSLYRKIIVCKINSRRTGVLNVCRKNRINFMSVFMTATGLTLWWVRISRSLSTHEDVHIKRGIDGHGGGR